MGTLRRLPGFSEPVEVDEDSRIITKVQGSEPEKPLQNKGFNEIKVFDADHHAHTFTHTHDVRKMPPHMEHHNNLESLESLEPASNGAGLRVQGSEPNLESLERVVRFHPPPGSVVARIIAAGGATSIAGHRPDGSLFKHAWLPAGIGPAFVAELKADGWTTSDRETTEAYVAQCWRRAEAALTNVTDANRGEVEDDT